MSDGGGMDRYLESCRTEFWEAVFQAEVEYIVKHLAEGMEVLSVGCGPAIIEGLLTERGYSVTGLDVSREALERAPEGIRTFEGRAEEMPFDKASFDAVIFVASMQFIEDYVKAVEETMKVLRPKGLLLAMLLNPESRFVRDKMADPESYVQRIRHTVLMEIEGEIAREFHIETEYLLGVKDGTVFESSNPDDAVLYVVRGVKRETVQEVES